MQAANVNAFVKDNGVAIFGYFIINLKAFVLMPMIIKTLGVEVYGGYVLLNSLLSISFGLSGLGVGISAKRYLPSATEVQERRKLFFPQLWFTFVMVLLVAFVIYMSSVHIKAYLFGHDASYSSYIVVVYLVTYFFYAQGIDYFRYTSRVAYMTLGSTLYPYLYMTNILVLIYAFDFISVDALVLSEAASAGVIALVCFIVLLKEIGIKVKFYSLNEMIKEIRLGLPLSCTVIVDFVLSASDRYLLLFFLSVSAVGYYQPGYLLGTLVMLVPKAMSLVLPQLLSKAIDRGDEQSAYAMVDYTTKLFFLIAVPCVFGTLIFGKQVLTILANAEVAQYAFWVAPIVSVASVFFGLTYIVSNILFVKLQTGVMLKVNLLASSINLLANFILLYFFKDILIAAITTLLSYYISFVYVRKKVMDFWRIDFDWPFINKIILASALMAAAGFADTRLVDSYSPVVQIALLLPIAIVTYLAMLIALKSFSPKELAGLKYVLARRSDSV